MKKILIGLFAVSCLAFGSQPNIDKAVKIEKLRRLSAGVTRKMIDRARISVLYIEDSEDGDIDVIFEYKDYTVVYPHFRDGRVNDDLDIIDIGHMTAEDFKEYLAIKSGLNFTLKQISK